MTEFQEMLEKAPDHVKKYIDELNESSDKKVFQSLFHHMTQLINPLILIGLIWTMFYDGPEKVSNLVIGTAWIFQIICWIVAPFVIFILTYAAIAERDTDLEKTKNLDAGILNKKMLGSQSITMLISEIINMAVICLMFMIPRYFLGASMLLLFCLFNFFSKVMLPEWSKSRLKKIIETLNEDGTWKEGEK